MLKVTNMLKVLIITLPLVSKMRFPSKLHFRFQFDSATHLNPHLMSSADTTLPISVTRTTFGSSSVLVPVLPTVQYLTGSEHLHLFVPEAENNFLQIVADQDAQQSASFNLLPITANWTTVPNTGFSVSI